MTIAGPAAVFARKYRQRLFPDTPLLLASVDQRYLGEAPLRDDEAAVAVLNDFPGVVDDILQVRPRTRTVFMVIGSGAISRFWRQRLEAEFGRFQGRLKFIWSDGMPFPELLRSCSTLPADSAIYYFTFGTDAAGAAYADERVIASLRATANAPLFAAHSVFLGQGIVGGRLLDIDEAGQRTSRVAYEILSGAPPRNFRSAPQLPGRPTFDWRELERWDIPETRLPPGSVVNFRAPTLWSEYRGTVLTAGGVLSIQALLIFGLLLERRARLRAEIESRRNLALASDVSRRETMSALTSSIAHELSQPLSAMIHNAEALQLMNETRRATPDVVREVLSDIHADGMLASQIIDRHRTMLRSRQMETKLIDLQTVLNDTLALVAHDMIARHVAVTTRLCADPCPVSGDPVLLEQVFVNLVMNAMDAMVNTPPEQRRITISSDVSDVSGADVEVSVHDAGPGLPADLAGKLFTPFVTTKPQGLGIGLAIAQNLVKAHGGSIDARNHPHGGAVFTVTLRIDRKPAGSSL